MNPYNITTNESLYQSVGINEDHRNSFNVCSLAPPNIVSDGFWGEHNRNPLKSSLPVFELQVLVIFAVTKICHFFLKRLDFPEFISQMLAGIILGSYIEIEALDRYKKMLFPYGSQDTLATISSIGYALFIFTTAVQMDLSMVWRTGHKAWTIAIMGLAAPFLVCILIVILFHEKLIKLEEYVVREIYNVVVAHTVISFAVVASLLTELKILNSELGRLALSSVLVSDILGLTTAGIASILVSHFPIQHPKMLVLPVLSFIAFGIFIPFICRPAMFWIIKSTQEGRPVDDGYIHVIIVMVFGLGCISVKMGQDFILGAFVLGLAVPEGPPLGSELVKKLQLFGKYLFLPIFVTCGVMKANFSLKVKTLPAIPIIAAIGLTHLVKIIAYLVPALLCNIPLKDSLALALILNAKGVVDIGFFAGLYDGGVMVNQTYAVMIISIMVIACIVKWSVKLLYDPSRKYAGYQKRNIMSLKPDSELRIISCIHKQCHISAMTHVIDLCSPTTEHPVIVDVLHLIELVGRTSPIFVSHRLQRSGSHKSYSDNVILAFDLYEHDNLGGVSAHTYTAISPPTLMFEDVCQLALDKVASLIILPFHRRWSIDGGIECDDKNIRSLNCRLLQVAPCSIGILVTRSSIQSHSSIRLAVVYLGGKDDREALCLAKRSMTNPNIELVVYHLATKENIPSLENICDNEALADTKKPNYGSKNPICYQKVIVNDGPETSTVLRDIANEHDFFIVGRRHGLDLPQIEGLHNWSEFSELGVIGDLLASPDFESRANVLVVQQQVKDG